MSLELPLMTGLWPKQINIHRQCPPSSRLGTLDAAVT
jgi:hypothetical protein